MKFLPEEMLFITDIKTKKINTNRAKGCGANARLFHLTSLSNLIISYPTARSLMRVELSYCISFIVTWVILHYASLLYIDLSYRTRIIVTRVILLY